MDIFKKCYDWTEADDARAANLYPFFHRLESRQDTEVMMEGRRRIMLGSNNYLGLTICDDVVEAGIKAIEKYGTGCSGSRFLNGTLDLHIELEEEIAKFLGREAALTFGTGFQSNAGIISALVGMHDYVICDRENHASIYAGCQLSYGKLLRFKHNDMADLKACLDRVPDECGALVVVDGVFSMGGDVINLPEVVRLAKAHGARVMVDDAHGLGVLGDGGRGTAFHYGLEKRWISSWAPFRSRSRPSADTSRATPRWSTTCATIRARSSSRRRSRLQTRRSRLPHFATSRRILSSPNGCVRCPNTRARGSPSAASA